MTLRVRSFATWALTATVLVGVVVILLASGRTAGAGPEATDSTVAAQATPTVVPTSSDSGAVDLRDALLEMGYRCWRVADVLVAEPTTEQLVALDARVQAVDVTEGWLQPEAGPWARDQLRFGGAPAGVAAAYGGTLYADNWVLTEKDGSPYAFSFRAIELPSGVTVWGQRDVLIPLSACPD
jgi:hypothetical protein